MFTMPDLSTHGDGVNGRGIPVAGGTVSANPLGSGVFRTYAGWVRPLVAALVLFWAYGYGVGVVKKGVAQFAAGNQLQLAKVDVAGTNVGGVTAIAYVPWVVTITLTFSSTLGAFLFGLGTLTWPSVQPVLVGGVQAVSSGSYAVGMNGFVSGVEVLALGMFRSLSFVDALVPLGMVVGTLCGAWVLRLKTDFFVMGALAAKAHLAC